MSLITGGGGASLGSVTSVTGTAASGQVPVASSSSAASWKYPPGFEFGYDQITANVTVSSTTEATGTTVITCGAHTFDGSAVLATFFSAGVAPASVAGAQVVVCLFESTTEIARLSVSTNPAASAFNNPVTGMLRFTPTTGAHTYTVTAFQANGNGSILAGAGGTAVQPPAFIRFTKV